MEIADVEGDREERRTGNEEETERAEGTFICPGTIAGRKGTHADQAMVPFLLTATGIREQERIWKIMAV